MTFFLTLAGAVVVLTEMVEDLTEELPLLLADASSTTADCILLLDLLAFTMSAMELLYRAGRLCSC
jgi:hypothetical protein